MSTKHTQYPRVEFAQLLARLDRIQMYNRLEAHSLTAGRAEARQIATQLRTIGAQLPPTQRRRAIAAHAQMRQYAKSRKH